MNTTHQNRPIPILMYHSIAANASASFRKFAVPEAHFEAQLQYLAEKGYQAITVSRLAAAMAGTDTSALPDCPVVITFDDGFADFHSTALPLLQRYRFNATLYLATSFIGGTSLWL